MCLVVGVCVSVVSRDVVGGILTVVGKKNSDSGATPDLI